LARSGVLLFVVAQNKMIATTKPTMTQGIHFGRAG
jgi:hypothetical protein